MDKQKGRMNMLAAVPKDSATVILVRCRDADQWEVFLARRHHNQSFMADVYVFPGGQVADVDRDERLNRYLSVSEDFNPRVLLQADYLSPETAQSFYICAVRETFEETGVLICRTASGNSVKLDSDQTSSRFTGYRRELNADRITLIEIAQKENLFFPLEALVPFAHWITPVISPKRFSTRFFLARLPEGQTTTTDCSELTESLWASPKDVLRKYEEKKITLMPPTLKIMEELSIHTSLDELFAAARKRFIYPILPDPTENILKLPYDPEYGIPEYKRPVRPDEPSRIISDNGIWKTAFYHP